MSQLRTGDVFIRNFDQGIVETIGGVLTQQTVDDGRGGTVQQTKWMLPVSKMRFLKSLKYPGIGPDGAVQITIVAPEETYESELVPEVIVKRGDPAPATARFHPHTIVYDTPSAAAKVVTAASGRVGVDVAEVRNAAFPFDIPYDIDVRTRVRNDSTAFLKHLLWIFRPPASPMWLRDSLGDKRTYDAFLESLPAINELASVAERVVGFSLSIRVEGELDLYDSETERTVISTQINVRVQ